MPSLRLIQPLAEAIKSLPKTRYYGSKLRLLPWIYENVGGLRFDTALDLFGGTASVSQLFRLMRKRVTYNDGLRFNEDVARAVLSPEIALSRSDLVNLLARVRPLDGLVTRRFDGVFYTREENRWIDGFMGLVGIELCADVRAVLRYLLYQSCLKKRPFNLFHRANLALRTKADVQRSFGNARTWERPFDELVQTAFDELAASAQASYPSATVLPAASADEISPGYDLVYIDPPYVTAKNGRNRDDYWRRYHFLEGLSRYPEWEDLMDPTSAIRLPPTPQWMLDWSRRERFQEHLFSLVDKHKASIVALSYVTDAFPNETIIKAFFEQKFAKVSLHSKPLSHALSKSHKRELLFIGHPKT
jgi:adenine-specific DNA-methyltransferase